MLGFDASSIVNCSPIEQEDTVSVSVAGTAVTWQTCTLVAVSSQGRLYWNVRVVLPEAVARNVQYSVPPPPGSPGFVATYVLSTFSSQLGRDPASTQE